MHCYILLLSVTSYKNLTVSRWNFSVILVFHLILITSRKLLHENSLTHGLKYWKCQNKFAYVFQPDMYQ